MHQTRKNLRGRGISIFVHESLFFKRRKDLSINLETVESLSIEILNKSFKKIILDTITDPQMEILKNFFKNLFEKNDRVNKHIFFAIL